MKALPRPPAVTMACAFVGISSLLLLLELVQALTAWGTIEMQKGLEPTLTALRDNGFDLTMVELLRILRWVGLSSVLLAVAGVVFAAYAVRGDRVARVGTTAVAVILGVLVLSLGWLGVLQTVLLLAAAVALWSRDARGWFDAKNRPEDELAPIDVFAAASSSGTAATPGPSTDEAPAPSTRVEQPRPTHRPKAVLAAGLVTVFGSALTGGVAALFLVVYGFARAEYVQMVQDGPFAGWFEPGEIDAALQTAFWACVVMLPLAVTGLAAGLSLLARLPVGRVATLALAWITAAAGVVLVPFGLLGTGAAIAVIVLLNRAESRAWTASAR